MKNGYQSLLVWQKAMSLTKEAYRLVATFPSIEQFGLGNQMRRVAISIPSNIAEGSRRGSTKDRAHFMRMAHGSLSELETQLLLARELYPETDCIKALLLAEEVGKMLYSLTKKLES